MLPATFIKGYLIGDEFKLRSYALAGGDCTVGSYLEGPGDKWYSNPRQAGDDKLLEPDSAFRSVIHPLRA